MMKTGSPLKLYDTLTAKTKPVGEIKANPVKLYVCGPTVYGLPHLGHGRFVVAFDVLVRWLRAKGLTVKYVSNITDIDDKIIKRAEVENTTVSEIASRYEDAWWAALKTLNVTRPDVIPHATEYVGAMISLIDTLYQQGNAYVISDGLYLDVSKVADYGSLIKQPLDSLKVGARVEINKEKRNPLDFALWKFSKPGEPFWSSPWGNGRPGWHTECVVMSLDCLGDGFDIHGGAQDLIFPHHENERAQAVLLKREFARHWVHNGLAMIEGEKMSKSLGNFTNLQDVFDEFDPRAFRIACLKANYRSPVELNRDAIKDAQGALERLRALVRRTGIKTPQISTLDELFGLLTKEFEKDVFEFASHMDNDLDTPMALAVIYRLVTKAHAYYDRGQYNQANEASLLVSALSSFLGITLNSEDLIPDEITQLVAKREDARKEKNWQQADILRKEIISRGYIVQDTPDGPKIFKQTN